MHLRNQKSATFGGLIIVALMILIGSAQGLPNNNNVVDSHLLTQKTGTNDTITVDANGEGDFKSVQAAIDHVPIWNSKWIIIHIKRGVYREKVSIPSNKPYILMRGDGRGKTSIVWSQSSENNYESATFKVEAPHFVAFGIGFKNMVTPKAGAVSEKNSVAAFVGADKVAFYHCAFFSHGNTLSDYKGRHYYDSCYIQGSVDVVFGQGQTMFHECEVFVINGNKMGGSIAGNERERQNQGSGFVFVKGKVYGVGGDVHLGRAKGSHSRVVFANTYLSRAVIPQGWTDWNFQGTTRNLHHAEYKCHGPGSDSVKRAHWSKQLGDKEAAPFLTVDFIKGKQWLLAWFT